MKAVIYGGGENCLPLFNNCNVEDIVFSDSNPELWGKKNFIGEEIVSPKMIDAKKYDFFVVGSIRYGEEIEQIAKDMGFKCDQIVPAEYLQYLFFQWRKGFLSSLWRNTLDSRITVEKMWWFDGKNVNCIVSIKDALWNELSIKAFMNVDCTSIKATILSDGSSCEVDLDDNLIIETNNLLLKIRIEGSRHFIPWVRFELKPSKYSMMLEKEKRKTSFVTFWEQMQNWFYHDEDYLALFELSQMGGTVLDLGGNYGQSSYAFYQIMEKAKIECCEAVPSLCSLIQLIISQQKMDDRACVHNIGISDKVGTMTWYEPQEGISGSFDKTFIEGRGIDYTEHELAVTTIDELYKDYNDIILIKLDVEGLELSAIRGAQETIKNNYPILLLERNEDQSEIVELLKDTYDEYYYDSERNGFTKNESRGINYWLIPKAKYKQYPIHIL